MHAQNSRATHKHGNSSRAKHKHAKTCQAPVYEISVEDVWVFGRGPSIDVENVAEVIELQRYNTSQGRMDSFARVFNDVEDVVQVIELQR